MRASAMRAARALLELFASLQARAIYDATAPTIKPKADTAIPFDAAAKACLRREARR